MRVLGFDPSLTNFGWSLHCDEGNGIPRCQGKGRFQTSSKMLFVDRYIELREKLRTLIQSEKPDRVSIEYPIFNDLYSEGMYGLFLFSCEALRLEKKDVVFFSPMQTKAHARLRLQRPKGWKMEKPDMVEAAKVDTDSKTNWNHNEADAYWTAVVGARFWRLFDGDIKEEDLTAVESQQFLKIHTFKKGKKAGETVKSGILHREDQRFFRWSLE